MAMSIGGVTIALNEQPDRGSYPFARPQRWVSQEALNLVGSVQQLMGVGPLHFRQHFALTPATKASLLALYESQASGAGPWAYINTDLPEPYLTGFNVIMQEFSLELNEENRGLPWYDTWIVFEEVVA